MKDKAKYILKSSFFNYLPSMLDRRIESHFQKTGEYLEWVDSVLLRLQDEYVMNNRLLESGFIRDMNGAFSTGKFDALLKRWTTEYLLKLLHSLDHYAARSAISAPLPLEDNPVHRLAFDAYRTRFKAEPAVEWLPQRGVVSRVCAILLQCMGILWLSLKNGVRLPRERKSYKVMREAVWGLGEMRGRYFHDDFFVDEKRIFKKDVVLFSRDSMEKCEGRRKACRAVKRSGYAHFYLPSLSIGTGVFFKRILPKYVVGTARSLLREARSPHFSLFSSVSIFFVRNAIPYERAFSHYRVGSELAHNFFSANHIPEAIICNNFGVGYYFAHWVDLSMKMDEYVVSNLGCDKYLVWGDAHVHGVEGGRGIIRSTGYIFKKFIHQVKRDRAETLRQMGIKPIGKIVTFFDETFGGLCKLTEDHYLTFWETALKLAKTESGNTVIIKPKELSRYNALSPDKKDRFIVLKDEIGRTPNAHIVDGERWSFVECIGISDVVVTEGMTSSSLIAILCGVEGVYLDQARCDHRFAHLFKDSVVFDDPGKLVGAVCRILNGSESVFRVLPKAMLREYDAFDDDDAVDRLRDVLLREDETAAQARDVVGIIVQARIGSTRLPGKVLKDIMGKPLLWHVVNRLSQSRFANRVIVATSTDPKDDAIEKFCRDSGIDYYRGSELDVLDRYYQAARRYGLDVVVRITGDCPLADPEVVDRTIGAFIDNKVSYDASSNAVRRTFPRGLDVEVFAIGTLERMWRDSHKAHQREHVTLYMHEHPELFRLYSVESDTDLSGMRWTVDEPADLAFVREVYDRLYKNGAIFLMKDVLRVLAQDPGLERINSGIEQKEVIR